MKLKLAVAAEDDVYRAPRCQCAKCGGKLKTPADSNVGPASYCATCRWLLRMGGVSKPLPAVMEAIGLGTTYLERQEAERIPGRGSAADWYEPERDIEAAFDARLRQAVA